MTDLDHVFLQVVQPLAVVRLVPLMVKKPGNILNDVESSLEW